MESTVNALTKPKPISADPQDVSSSSETSLPDNDEYFWQHPNKYWVEWLFEELQKLDFYKPHICLRHSTKRERKLEEGKVKVKF
jgi:hypothetical protein